MALLDTIRHRARRIAMRLAVAVIAVLAVGAPASAGVTDAAPSLRDTEGTGAFIYRDGDFRPLRPVRDAQSVLHLGINNRRQTVGTYADEGAVVAPGGSYPPEAIHGFIQDRRGRVTTIDVPGGDNEFPEGGINDRGQAAGVYIDAGAVPDPDGVFPPRGSVHGFIRSRTGRITTFDVPAPRMHAVTDINDHGQVVGYVDESFTSGSGFVRDRDGTITRIEVPGASYTEPRGITNDGRIVGSYEVGDRNPDGSVPPGRIHGFLRDRRGRITTFDVPGSVTTVPAHLNIRGDITGAYRDRAGRQHGFLLRHGRYTTIDAPGRAHTIAWGINDHGDVVIPEPGVGISDVAPGEQPPPEQAARAPQPAGFRPGSWLPVPRRHDR